MHEDQKYIDALLTHNQRLISEIYERFAPHMKAYLLSRGCSEEDAGDVFQEALIDIYKLAADKQFVLTCPFEAFLLLLCKRKFLNKIKKTSLKVVTNDDDDAFTHIPGDANAAAEEHTAQVEKEQLVMLVLNDMGNCKEVILKSLLKKPQEEIAEELGMTYAYYRKRKSNCMGELAEQVRNKPQFKELML
ncbi:MAG: sigma-70 family RNA polymerase sigma factor [Chitinophagaceae bacterium]|nr:sigma-70 family RNA polymerase sigma factor [Chitinophagaceae bacterium]